MNICQSCGGVIGRDCFNPEECSYITMQMQLQAEVEERLDWNKACIESAAIASAEIGKLQAENKTLRDKEISSNNLVMLLEKQIKRAESENESLKNDLARVRKMYDDAIIAQVKHNKKYDNEAQKSGE